jgi:cholecystokinin A receptor/hypocretin (orexin) receptor 2
MDDESPEDDNLVYIAIGLMSVCSVVGVIGNALVLYVFSSFKQKLTSTIFILTLATTDFITCYT